ncbi:MAG: tetratricopeptide repeat protein [Planctomycetes bacterium]|nr:tetratricopeptide repeat protein [Planctomycetota bacterium]
MSILSWQLSRRTDELAISAHNAQRQQHIALDLAEKRKVTAQSLATMVQSLASTYSSDATMDTLDARLREAAEMVKSGMLDDDVDTLMLMHRSLGGTLMARGMLRESLFHHQKYAELAAAKYGAISRQVTMALNSQTAALDRLGDYAAAEVTSRRSIQIDTQLQAKGASPRSAYISNLASILHAQGKFREAEELYRQRLASLIAEANEPRERIARAKRNISLELFSQGKIQEAESLVLEAIEDLKPASTTQIEIEDDLLRSYRNLALIRQQQGRLEEAERLQRQVVQGMIGLYGAKHTHLLQERVHLASILLSSGAQHPEKRGEAIMLLRDTESLYNDRAYPGSEHLVALRRLRQAHEPQ